MIFTLYGRHYLMAKAVKNKAVRKGSSSQPAKAQGKQRKAISQAEIEKAAYFRWLNRGGRQGNAEQDWIEAERDLRQN